MASLPSPFTIEIGGTPIAKVEDATHGPIQATLGSNAAVFTLKDHRLVCGDWALARNKSEDRSLLPKPALWFKLGAESDERAQPVSARKEGDEYQIRFADKSLTVEDSKVLVELMGDGHPNVVLKFQ
ncbi:Nn.00g091090.m01.CDS01 [Neocucurbitaria sp. VM-36]